MNNLYNDFNVLIERSDQPFIFDYNNLPLTTYKQMDQRVSQFCNSFNSLNLKPGDHIIQYAYKSIDNICIYLACVRMGLVYIPINPEFKEGELKHIIEDSKPSLIIADTKKIDRILTIKEKRKLNFIIKTISQYDLEGSIQQLANIQPTHHGIEKVNLDTTACILYTSGTTGSPKGVMLTHKNLTYNAKAIINCWKLNSRDKILHTLPIFHCHGLFFAINTSLICGAKLLFLDRFEVNNVIAALAHATVFMGVPTYFSRLLETKTFNKELTSNVRLFISGSAPLTEQIFKEFQSRTDKVILERYGMTETGIITSNPLNGERIVNSVGFALEGVDIRIDNSIDGIGTIQVKGKSVFKGYLNKKTSDFTKDGFFNTGDVGKIDKNDYLHIVGRAKDMIITGGINVYPVEIEKLINKLDFIKESAIVGLPNKDFGEALTVFVVAENSESKISSSLIVDYLKKLLANYKIPKKIIQINELPRNVMGKVQKHILRKDYNEIYK